MLTITENKWGSDHERVAGILNNMGEVYRMQRKYDKAIDVLNRALAIRKEKLGQDHQRTAYTLMRIANVLSSQGKLDEAMEKYQQVMPIYEKEFGSDSVEMATLLNNIALKLGKITGTKIEPTRRRISANMNASDIFLHRHLSRSILKLLVMYKIEGTASK